MVLGSFTLPGGVFLLEGLPCTSQEGDGDLAGLSRWVGGSGPTASAVGEVWGKL